MNKVVALRQRSITDCAHDVAVKFAQADRVQEKVSSLRVEIGRELNSLRFRIEERKELGPDTQFWPWIKQFVDRSRRDMTKCMALAAADDPLQAADDERTATRERIRKHRAESGGARAYSTPNPRVVSFSAARRLFEQILALPDEEREQLHTMCKEELQW